MNNLIVDGNTLKGAEIPGGNLEEILMNLMEHPSTSERVITKVYVNGENYSEEVPHAALEVERDAIESLELVTHSAEDLSLHFFQYGGYFIDTLRAALPKIVEAFRLGDEAEANEFLLSFLESFHLLVNMLEQTRQTMGLAEDANVAQDISLNQYLDKLSTALATMISLQEQGDWIFLADVLEFELDESLENLGKMLPLLTKSGH